MGSSSRPRVAAHLPAQPPEGPGQRRLQAVGVAAGRWASWFSDRDAGGGGGASAVTRQGLCILPRRPAKLGSRSWLEAEGGSGSRPGPVGGQLWPGPLGLGPRLLPTARSASSATFEGLRLISRKEKPRSQTAQPIRKELLNRAPLSTHPTVS